MAALPASWNAFAASLQGASVADASEPFWRMVKAQFPLEGDLIYLNAANVCPASRPVMDRHLEFLRDFHANPSFQNRDKYVANAREDYEPSWPRCCAFRADEIAITRNTSEGSNIVVTGIDLKPGDEVSSPTTTTLEQRLVESTSQAARLRREERTRAGSTAQKCR